MTHASILEKPKEEFPYQPHADAIKERYRELSDNTEPFPVPVAKLIFDKLAAGIILVLSLPVLAALYFFNWIEVLLIPENRGSLFFPDYHGCSAGSQSEPAEHP